jgi:hypothetical protein
MKKFKRLIEYPFFDDSLAKDSGIQYVWDFEKVENAIQRTVTDSFEYFTLKIIMYCLRAGHVE